METNEKNLKKLEKLLSLMDEESLSKEDFAKAFENVVKTVKKLEERNMAEFEMLKVTFKKFSDKIAGDTSFTLAEMKTEVKNTVDKYMGDFSSRYDIIKEELNRRASEIKDGKDADVDEVVDIVLSKIELPEIKGIEEDLPKMGNPIRDALELLQGDDRLSADAISGLEKMIKKLAPKTQAVGGVNYGALNIHFADDEAPTGLINGTNKEFKISLAPSPASSLKVFMNGQRMKLTEDYTFSGNTITFVNAPLTGSIITCDYRQ
jgi:uncharacterized protein YajQ (UPF0234 family)